MNEYNNFLCRFLEYTQVNFERIVDSHRKEKKISYYITEMFKKSNLKMKYLFIVYFVITPIFSNKHILVRELYWIQCLQESGTYSNF